MPSGADTRRLALEVLYEVEQAGAEAPELEDLTHRARRLVRGVLKHRQELDEVLDGTSPEWRVERMPPIDRSLLRMGLYELRYEPETPVGVIISEAVRLAKEYSTERSGAFVNGVLGRLAKEERST
ncbi:MAG: transcription antitermination factor NusB [Actinomycetota bacterium]|nr:transcription antitermination factor NusB [Actinomycetota bacterium]